VFFTVKNKVSSQTINRLIVAFSLIVFRIDAFMNNFIEYSFIITYLVGAFKCMNNQFPNLSELMFDIIIVNIVASLIYSIVYVINDFIDFNKVRNFRENFTKFSFYAIRPIIYFNRSIFILIYLIGLYVFYVYCTLIFFSTTTIFLIGILILVSVVHSLLQDNIRPITFFMLRMIKYVLFLYLLSNVLPSLGVRDIFTISLPLIVPYTALQTYFYAVQKNVFSRQSYISILTKICILISTILTFLYVSLVVNSPQVVESIIVGYIAISPFLIIRSGLRKILGPENRDFYVHIKRLSLATLLTTCVIFMVILILS
jgi:hypothetical protein